MSLWKNNDGAKSAPIWYAHHCVFNGKNVVDNKIDLTHANTSFKTGDAVIYLSDVPLTGLTNETVYYVRSVDGFRVTLHTSRANAKSGTSPVAVTASTSDSKQLFVEYARSATTNDGKDIPALVAVDKALALQRINGIVSPGWYRYFKFKGNDNRDRIHLELLASVKTMSVTVVPKYTVTPSHFSSAGDNGWDPYGSDNTMKIVLHPTESITGNATVKILGKYGNETLFKDHDLTFSNVKGSTAAGDLIPYDANGYMTLTMAFNGTNDVSKEIYIVSGDLAGIWHGTVNFNITSTNGNVNASIPEINVYS